MNLNKYKGLGQFGPTYKIMFENDIHAPNSVDRVLTKQMVLLCPKTQKYLYSKFTPMFEQKIDFRAISWLHKGKSNFWKVGFPYGIGFRTNGLWKAMDEGFLWL